MRQRNEYRVINEDIAALRNIAWAAIRRANLEGRQLSDAAVVVYKVSDISLHSRDDADSMQWARESIYSIINYSLLST